MRFILILILLIAAIAFAVQNANVVTLVFFVWRVEASLAIVVAVCFSIGALVAALALAPSILRKRAETRRLRTQLHEHLSAAEDAAAANSGSSEQRP